MLPYSRSTDYTDDQVPAISAQDLNDVQDGVAEAKRGKDGEDFVFYDDFTGQSLDAGKWKTAVTSGTGTAAIATSTPVRLSGAFKMQATGGDGQSQILTQVLNPGLLDFRMITSVLAESVGGTSTVGVLFSLDVIAFKAGNGSNWIVNISGTPHDTGVAVNNAATQVLEIRRTNGVFVYLIDGDEVYSETVAIDLNGALTQSINRATAGTVTLYTDYVKLWHRR
jgi:hypothetical protein